MNKQWKLFLLFFVIALLAVLFTKPFAEGFVYSNGKELLSWYIPLPIAVFYFLLNIYLEKNIKATACFTLLLFLLLWMPFLNDLLSTYQYYPQDDGTRYRMVATHIVENATLNAGDGLLFGTTDKTYMIQPGYRYYLAGWIKIFGKENRLYQVWNMFLYVFTICFFFKSSEKLSLPLAYRRGIMLFVLLSSPFVVKLILLGLTEWLAVTILMLAACFYFYRRLLPAVVLLALLPFIRQNLIVVSVIIFLWIILNENRKWLSIALFIAILLLPLYHNLYYAGKWQLFSVYDDPSTFLVLDFEGTPVMKLVKNVLYHLSLYSGYNWRIDNFWANVLSLASIPMGTYLAIKGFVLLESKSRWWYLAIVMAAIVPTLIFGGAAYYPRFEWVNLFISILTFMLMQRDSFPSRHLVNQLKIPSAGKFIT